MKLAESYAELIAQAQEPARRARRRRFHNVIMLGVTGASIAAAFAGLPVEASVAFFVVGVGANLALRALL